MSYHIIPGITSYHIYIIISYCIFIQYTFYITLHCIILLMYIWWWWRWWSSLVRPCIWTKDYVYFNWPTSQCSPTGPFVFTRPLGSWKIHPKRTSPCTSFISKSAVPGLSRQQNSGGVKSDSFETNETNSKSNMSGMSLNRVIPLSICLTFRITRYNRSTNVYTKCYVSSLLKLLQGSKL